MPKDGELRNDNWSSVDFTNAVTDATHAAGLLFTLGDGLIGFFVEDVGTSGAAKSDAFPHGEKGSLIYNAEKVILPKVTGAGLDFSKGDTVYYDAAGATNKLTDVTTGNDACGEALEDASTTATQVLVDFDGRIGV